MLAYKTKSQGSSPRTDIKTKYENYFFGYKSAIGVTIYKTLILPVLLYGGRGMDPIKHRSSSLESIGEKNST